MSALCIFIEVTRLWDATTGENIVIFDKGIGPLAWSADGRFFISDF